MRFREAARFESDLFSTDYVVGTTEDGRYIYVWAPAVSDEGDVPDAYVTDPTCDRGAVVGTLEEVIEELETCVGSFRYWGTPEQAAEADVLVEKLTTALRNLEVSRA